MLSIIEDYFRLRGNFDMLSLYNSTPRKIEGGIDRISNVSFRQSRFCTLLKCTSFIFKLNIYVSDFFSRFHKGSVFLQTGRQLLLLSFLPKGNFGSALIFTERKVSKQRRGRG